MSQIYKYTLTYNSTSLILLDNPAGWDSLGISFVRNMTYHSVLRNFSLSLRFPKTERGGGQFIMDAYNSEGLKAEIGILIEKRDPQTDDFVSFYNGILDFNPDKFVEERDFVEISIIDGSKEQKFIVRDQINYDLYSEKSTDNITIDSFVSNPQDINMKPIDIYLKVDQSGNLDEEVNYTSANIPGLIEEQILFYADQININEIGNRLKTEDGPDQADRTIEIYENSTEFESTIKVDDMSIINDTAYIHAVNPGLGVGSFHILIGSQLQIFDQDDNLVNNYYKVHANIYRSGFTGTLDIPINYSFSYFITNYTIPAGGYATFKIRVIPLNTTTAWFGCAVDYLGSLEINFDFTEISIGEVETTSEAFFPHEAFTRLIQLMTSETDTSKLFYSEFFGRTDSEFQTYSSNGNGSLDAIMNGFNIRKFPNKPMNINMRDLFKSFDKIYNIGLGYDRTNDRFFIEKKSEFYKNNLIADLGEVSNFKRKPFKEAYFTQILSGYSEKIDYEDFQGAYEYNVQSEHSISTFVKETGDYRIPYKADSIGIELTRRKQYKNYAAEDTKQDEKIFIIRTDGSNTIQNGTSVTGFQGVEDYYNKAFLPRECLIRNGSIIKSALYKNPILIKFINSQKSINVQYINENGDLVNELDDINDSDLTENAIFIPEIYEFDGEINKTIIDALNNDPHGYFRCTFDDESYEGYVNKIESEDYNEKAVYNLIAKDATEYPNYLFEDYKEYVFEDDQVYEFEN